MKVTIGGDRVGSGNKMKTTLPNYGRSTHDLSEDFQSSAAPGVLIPFMKKIAVNGDTFDINLESQVKTIPTMAPLFGSFKLQLDVYACPIRLYHGVLHNNPINIGLKMNQVKLPIMKLPAVPNTGNIDLLSTGTNSLPKYMGISGTGILNAENAKREFQCIPELAYYDIFKCYYANKQEKKAYVIEPNADQILQEYEETYNISVGQYINIKDGRNNYETYYIHTDESAEIEIEGAAQDDPEYALTSIMLKAEKYDPKHIIMTLYNDVEQTNKAMTLEEWNTFSDGELVTVNHSESLIFWNTPQNRYDKGYYIGLYIKKLTDETILDGSSNRVTFKFIKEPQTTDIQLTAFDLVNIDKMREYILKNSELGSAINIANFNKQPYNSIIKETLEGYSQNMYPMNGLVVKTYQSDLFNNWLDTEWIDGENGIAELTAITAVDGKIKVDDINFAEKLYNLLNRIAISGGTYQDWQRATYGQALNFIETPVWCGGMSSEIVFEEVVSTANTDNETLGGLAGKGRLLGKKGGHITIKVNEPSYIIGIMSITPRIVQTQGNDFDRTEIFTLDDLHKPELDGIGFQELMCEQMAWWDTKVGANGALIRNSAGKVPAWINYMTSVNKAYGDFANIEGKNFMVLARNYERDTNTGKISDLTTYIDPSKFNYAFAVQELAAQNFWVQIACHITARRKMSAKIIPNV